MFGTYEKHNLLKAAFTRESSFWAFYQDFREPIIGFTVIKDGVMLDSRSNTFLLETTFNGISIPYTYYADESVLRLTTDRGTVEFCLNETDQMRIRGNNIGLRVVLRAESPFGSAAGCKGIYPTPEGCWEADMGYSGKILFVPLEGSMHLTAPWDRVMGEYEKVWAEFSPNAANGIFEAALHEYMDYRKKDQSYLTFDQIRKGSKKAFDDYVEKNLRKPPKGWEDLFKYVAYVCWSHRTGIAGNYKEQMIMMQQVWAGYAMSWQQSYNALPMLKNPAEGLRLIKSMFRYQNPDGHVSMTVNYYNVATGGFQPAFQALALDWLISQCGDEFLTAEECEYLYPRFEKWLNFWLTHRNAGHGDDRVNIFGAHESGWDDLSLYAEGFPLETPDLFAYMIFLMDNLALMAKKLGMKDKEKDWTKRSKKLLNSLLTDLWDGESFVGYLPQKKKIVKCKSLAMFQCLCLGKERIPQEIIDKLAEEVVKPEYLTDIGLTTESLESPLCHFGYNFVLGRVITPSNMLTAMGFYRCGRKDIAKLITERVCKNIYEKGVILGFAPYDFEITTGKPINTYPNPTASDGWPWNSWAGSSVLTMLQVFME
ncbi:MAG: hypothetical protein GX111_00170 [Clostridiales bacterium]|nr:hypothetical protein [Clostridiales bacterium]